MFCVNCGFRNKDDIKFCINCGNPMDQYQATQQQPYQYQTTQQQQQHQYQPAQQSFQPPPLQHPYKAAKHKRKGKVRVVIGSFLCGFQILGYVAAVVIALRTGSPVFGNFGLSAGGETQTAEFVGYIIGFNIFVIVGIILLLVGISKFKKSKPNKTQLSNQYMPSSGINEMVKSPKSDKTILLKLVAIGALAVLLVFILIMLIGGIGLSMQLIQNRDAAGNGQPPLISDNIVFVSTFEAIGSRFKILDGWKEESINGRATVFREDNTSIGITFNVTHADGYELDTFVDMLVGLEADTEGYMMIDRRSIDIGEYEGAYLYTRYLLDGDEELFVHHYIVVKDEIGYILVYLALTHPAIHLAEVELMVSTLEID